MKPCDRQPYDTSKSYSWFLQYLLMGHGNRSLAKLARLHGRKPSYVRQLKKWSTAHRWGYRALAFDHHCGDLRITMNGQPVESPELVDRVLSQLSWYGSIKPVSGL